MIILLKVSASLYPVPYFVGKQKGSVRLTKYNKCQSLKKKIFFTSESELARLDRLQESLAAAEEEKDNLQTEKRKLEEEISKLKVRTFDV